MYYGECKPRNRIVEMYHAGNTLFSERTCGPQLMSEDLWPFNYAFSLQTVCIWYGGLTAKEVRCTIHFEPSKKH